jgi:2-polyprenyl-3-methyl-5-hydroxy-6-metoxy-1,4-benzoquinol methylase
MTDAWNTEREPSATVRYFDGVASGWSQKYRRSRHFQTRLNTVLGWLAAYPTPLDVLDYGCGSGVLLQALAEAGHAATGADVSEGMLAEARRQLAGLVDENRVRLVPVNADGEGDYRDRTYDGVISLGVLEYCPQPARLLERLASVVKPGGFLMLSFPNRNSGLRWVERYVARHPGIFRRLGWFPHVTGPDSYLNHQTGQCTVAELTGWLAAQGFVLRRRRYHVAPGWLGGLESLSWVGMTVLAEWVKSSEV